MQAADSDDCPLTAGRSRRTVPLVNRVLAAVGVFACALAGSYLGTTAAPMAPATRDTFERPRDPISTQPNRDGGVQAALALERGPVDRLHPVETAAPPSPEEVRARVAVLRVLLDRLARVSPPGLDATSETIWTREMLEAAIKDDEALLHR